MKTKEEFREIIAERVKEVWIGRRSINPIKEQTDLLTESLYPLYASQSPEQGLVWLGEEEIMDFVIKLNRKCNDYQSQLKPGTPIREIKEYVKKWMKEYFHIVDVREVLLKFVAWQTGLQKREYMRADVVDDFLSSLSSGAKDDKE